MIPASYLYKDAYRQHWGREFGRIEGEAPTQPTIDYWPLPSALRTARDLFDLALGPRRDRR